MIIILTLVEAKKLVQDEVQAGVIYSVYNKTPIFDVLPFETITGSAMAYNRVNSLGTAAVTRPLNTDYTEETVGFQRLTASLGRVGGKAQVDDYLVQTGSNLNDQLAVQTEVKAKKVAVGFQNMFFNGDTAVDPNGFDGLKKLLAGTAQELSGTDVISLATLDEAILNIDGDASAVFMNDKTLLKINALAKGSGLVQYNSLDMLGARVSSYAGIPIIRAGKVENTQVLADGEIYVVRFGADGVHGIQANTPTPKFISADNNANAPVWTVRIDWFAAIAQKALDSAFRLKVNLA